MFNVFLLNMFYDVPVKLFSFNLLLMAIFLIGPDLRALSNLLLLNRRAEPRNAGGVPLHRPYLRRSAIALKVLIIGTLLFSVLEQWQQYQRYIVHPKVSKLYGIWNVEKLNENGHNRPPLATDSSRWWKVAISNTGSTFAVRTMSDSFVRYRAKLDDAGKVLTLSEGNAPFNDNTPGVRYTFAVSQSDAAPIELKSNSLELTLRRLDPHTYPLLTRGFHWINELPYNR